MIQSLTKQEFNRKLKEHRGSLIQIAIAVVVLLFGFALLVYNVLTYFNLSTGIIEAILTQWMILFLYGFGTLIVGYLLRTNQQLTWSVFKTIIDQFLAKSLLLSLELGVLAFILNLITLMFSTFVWILFIPLMLYSSGAFLLILDYPTTSNQKLIVLGFKKGRELLSLMRTLNVGNVLMYSFFLLSMISFASSLLELSWEVRQTISSVNVALFLIWAPLCALHMMFETGYVYSYSTTLTRNES